MGKGRPKFARRGKFVSTYTPQTTASYENLVKLCYEQASEGYTLTGEISASITAYYPIPNSAGKKRTQAMRAGQERPTKKPDADNVAKIVLDSLNALAYPDDSAVVELRVMKFYSDTPRVEVEISEIDTRAA